MWPSIAAASIVLTTGPIPLGLFCVRSDAKGPKDVRCVGSRWGRRGVASLGSGGGLTPPPSGDQSGWRGWGGAHADLQSMENTKSGWVRKGPNTSWLAQLTFPSPMALCHRILVKAQRGQCWLINLSVLRGCYLPEHLPEFHAQSTAGPGLSTKSAFSVAPASSWG